MTDFDCSNNFANGLSLCYRYATENFSINVVETSGITVKGLLNFPEEDLEYLRSINWDAGNNEGGWAQYFKLKYENY